MRMSPGDGHDSMAQCDNEQAVQHSGVKNWKNLGLRILKKYDKSRKAEGKCRNKIGMKQHIHSTLKCMAFKNCGGLKFAAFFYFIFVHTNLGEIL